MVVVLQVIAVVVVLVVVVVHDDAIDGSTVVPVTSPLGPVDVLWRPVRIQHRNYALVLGLDRLLLVQWQTKLYIFLHRLLQPSPSAGCGFARRGTYLVNLLSSRQRLMHLTLRAQLRILNVHVGAGSKAKDSQNQQISLISRFCGFFGFFYFLFCTYDSSATE